jgi:hypothetical protein
MSIMIDMGENKIKDHGLKATKPADFKPSGAIQGTSLRFNSVNLIEYGRFV